MHEFHRGIGRFVFKSLEPVTAHSDTLLDVDLAANVQRNLLTHSTLNFPTDPSAALREVDVNCVVHQSSRRRAVQLMCCSGVQRIVRPMTTHLNLCCSQKDRCLFWR